MMRPPPSHDVYISYNKLDEPAVKNLVQRLGKEDINTWTFNKVRPGEDWAVAMDTALRNSKTSIVLIGKSGLGEGQKDEIENRIAQRVVEAKGNFPVIPVLLPGADGATLPPFLASKTWVHFSKSFNERAFHQLVSSIKDYIGRPVNNPTPDPPPNEAGTNPTTTDTIDKPQMTLSELFGSTVAGKRLRPDEAKALQLAGGYCASKVQPVDSALLLGAMLRSAIKGGQDSESVFLGVLLKQRVEQTDSTSAANQPVEVELLGLPTEFSSYLRKGQTGSWSSAVLREELSDILSVAVEIAEQTHSKSKAIHTRHLLGAILAANPEKVDMVSPAAPSGLEYQPSALMQLQWLGFDLNKSRKDFLIKMLEREDQSSHDVWRSFIRPFATEGKEIIENIQPEGESQPEIEIAERSDKPSEQVVAVPRAEGTPEPKIKTKESSDKPSEEVVEKTQPEGDSTLKTQAQEFLAAFFKNSKVSDTTARSKPDTGAQKPATKKGKSKAKKPLAPSTPARPTAITYYDNRTETQIIGPPPPAAAKDKVSIYVWPERVALWHDDQPYNSPNLINSVDLAEATSPQDYGELLFNGIIHGKGFAGENNSSTLEGFEQARRDNQNGFCLEMWVEPGNSDLNLFKWEYLKEPGSLLPPLSAYEKSPFYRRARSTKKGPIAANPLKILIAICNPTTLGRKVDDEGKPINPNIGGLAKIDVTQERAIIKTALARLEQAKVAEYEIFDGSKEPVTLEAIREKIQEGYHILHLLSHGIFIDGQYFLVMEDENRQHKFVPAERFRQTLSVGQQLRLVVLAACQSATKGTGIALKGLGPSLVGEEIPAVIAMQDEVKVETAQLFTQYFYDDLARTGRVDKAMAATRFALYQKSDGKEWQWGIPVLFMSTDDGQLLKVDKQKAALLPALTPDVKSYDQLAGQGNPAARKMAQAIESEARHYGAVPEMLGALRAVVAPSLAAARSEEEPLARPQERDALTNKLTRRVHLDAIALQMYVEEEGSKLELHPSVYGQLASALNAGKHIILIGPPGTGKTSLAHAVCQYAVTKAQCAAGVTLTTATADWTAFDTIGGYVPTAQQVLQFRPGIFLEAISSAHWLVIDEINRAEIDKAFGELFTVLSGQQADLPYAVGKHQVRVLPPADAHPQNWIPQNGNGLGAYDYVMHPTWRILATMNVYDKSSLFAMSFAFMRRFAFVDVDLPDTAIYDSLIDRWAKEQNLDRQQQNIEDMLQKLRDLLKTGNPLSSRALGPAIIKDMIWYIGNRLQFVPGVDPTGLLGEAFLLYVTPQLDGLDRATIISINKYLQDAIFTGQAVSAVSDSLQRRIRSLYPHIGSDDWKQ